jgi:AmmeMemoRadiSam system protein A
MALGSALQDQRFSPVQPEELKEIDIEISVLSPLKHVRSPEEVVPGRDGVLISKHGRTGVFLPQVATEQHWGRTELLENLCRKAGLPSEDWRQDAELYTFQAEVFGEEEIK